MAGRRHRFVSASDRGNRYLPVGVAEDVTDLVSQDVCHDRGMIKSPTSVANQEEVRERIHRERIAPISLGLIALLMAPAAVQATFIPRSFFDDFPLGRHWISRTGDLYNEHLVRDVGGLFAAMIIVTVWTLWRRYPTRPIATAWLIQGALHLWFHGRHLHGYQTIDRIGLIASSAAIPMLAVVTIWTGRTRRTDTEVQ